MVSHADMSTLKTRSLQFSDKHLDSCTGSVCYRRLVTTMVMSAKTEFWIAVIGLSGRENGESFQGPGKSCLCDRFMFPDKQPSSSHTSIVSQQDFHGPIINTDHFLYWGRTRRTVDGKMVEFNVIEQTEFLDDVTFSPFNARDPYIKRSTSTTINSSRKIQYMSPEHLQDPKSQQKAQKFASRKLHIDGFLCVYDVSKVNDRQAGTQYKFVFELLDLIDVPVVLVATKCDKGRSRHFEEMMYLAKVQKVPIVETSALENVNVSQAFFSLVRIFNRQVIVSKKHIQYFNPKELKKKAKKDKKLEKRKKKKKELKSTLNKISSPATTKRNGSVASKNESDISGEWPVDLAARSSNEPSLLPTPRDSPLTDSLLSEAPYESPYEHINGEDQDGDVLYENCHEFAIQDGGRFSSHDSAPPRQQDNESRDSQQSKSDSLQSKTSSEEYIPVPRAPYDPVENYENLRYHQTLRAREMCPSPNSHSSDSERGFLTGVPEHMKSMASQRPWETQYYTNVVIEPARNRQQSDHTSSGTRSSSSIDTDSQANIHFGRQLSLTAKKYPPPSSGSSCSNGYTEGYHTEHQEQLYANVMPKCQAQEPDVPEDVPLLEEVMTSQAEEDLPPYPVIVLEDDQMLDLNKDLEEMNTLVGEISNLVWQNEPMPPPPDYLGGDTTPATTPSDHLTPNPIPDFEKTPTNELASPNVYPLDAGYANVTPSDNFTYALNDAAFDLETEGYENVSLASDDALRPGTEDMQPPPRVPPRAENSGEAARQGPSHLQPRADNSGEAARQGPSHVPERIPLTDRGRMVPILPPREVALPPRDVILPPRTVTLPPRTVTLPPREVKLPPRALPPRDSLTMPRNANSTAQARDVTLFPRDVTGLTRDGALPPRVPLRHAALPHRIPAPHFHHHNNTSALLGNTALLGNSSAAPPNVPPRHKADNFEINDFVPHISHPQNSFPSNSRMRDIPLPVRVPLPHRPGVPPQRSGAPQQRHEAPPQWSGAPPQRPSKTAPPVYSEVEKRRNFNRLHQHDFSPYVIPSAPKIDRWEEYTIDSNSKKSQSLKKKVKVKIPQR